MESCYFGVMAVGLKAMYLCIICISDPIDYAIPPCD